MRVACALSLFLSLPAPAAANAGPVGPLLATLHADLSLLESEIRRVKVEVKDIDFESGWVWLHLLANPVRKGVKPRDREVPDPDPNGEDPDMPDAEHGYWASPKEDKIPRGTTDVSQFITKGDHLCGYPVDVGPTFPDRGATKIRVHADPQDISMWMKKGGVYFFPSPKLTDCMLDPPKHHVKLEVVDTKGIENNGAWVEMTGVDHPEDLFRFIPFPSKLCGFELNVPPFPVEFKGNPYKPDEKPAHPPHFRFHVDGDHEELVKVLTAGTVYQYPSKDIKECTPPPEDPTPIDDPQQHPQQAAASPGSSPSPQQQQQQQAPGASPLSSPGAVAQQQQAQQAPKPAKMEPPTFCHGKANACTGIPGKMSKMEARPWKMSNEAWGN